MTIRCARFFRAGIMIISSVSNRLPPGIIKKKGKIFIVFLAGCTKTRTWPTWPLPDLFYIYFRGPVAQNIWFINLVFIQGFWFFLHQAFQYRKKSFRLSCLKLKRYTFYYIYYILKMIQNLSYHALWLINFGAKFLFQLCGKILGAVNINYRTKFIIFCYYLLFTWWY